MPVGLVEGNVDVEGPGGGPIGDDVISALKVDVVGNVEVSTSEEVSPLVMLLNPSWSEVGDCSMPVAVELVPTLLSLGTDWVEVRDVLVSLLVSEVRLVTDSVD